MRISEYLPKTQVIPLAWLFFLTFCLSQITAAQNVGIGTTTPEAKLHVNGDLKLQNGHAVNKFSTDSLFTANSHSNVPTEKAIKDYLKKGLWSGADVNSIGPSAPIPRGFANNNLNNPTSVFVQGNYAYVTSQSNSNLCIFDISNPDAIVAKGFTSNNLNAPVSVFVQGIYAYVSSNGNSRLCIFDISNPDLIVPKGYISTNLSYPEQLFVQGNYAYVASLGNHRLCIFDISNPDVIVAKGYTNTNLEYPRSVYVQGNYAYTASYDNGRVCIFDISNPDNIVAKGYTTENLGGPYSVFVQGNYAYVASLGNNRLCIFDISDPDLIVAKGYISDNLSSPQSVFIQGNYAFVISLDNDNLCIFDISNPDLIIAKGFNSGNLLYTRAVHVNGNFAYVLSLGKGLSIFDLDKQKNISINSTGIISEPKTWQIIGSNVFRSNGNVGIGTSLPGFPLNFRSSIGDKISLYGESGNHYGFGISSYLMQIHTDVPEADIAFGYGKSDAFTEVMRVKGSGRLGLGTSDPNATLEVLRGTAPGGTAMFRGTTYTSIFDSGSNQDTYIRAGKDDRSVILNDIPGGRVGVGLANPQSTLDVLRGTAPYGTATLRGSTYLSHFNYGTEEDTYIRAGKSNRFVILNDIPGGKVGIGTTNPNAPLGFLNLLEKKITLYPGSSGDVGFAVFGNQLQIYADHVGAMVRLGYDQNVGGFISNFEVYGNGNAWLRGTLTQASDVSLKKNIIPIQNSLTSLMQMKAYRYQWKNSMDSSIQIGLIAQEVQNLFPELVKQNSEGELAINYNGMIPLLLNAIKEQQQQIDDLKKLVEKLSKH